MRPVLSVVVPTLNEGAVIESLLSALQPLRESGCEIIVSDGGSTDATCERALGLCDRLVSGGPGRAVQMNRGASVAEAGWLWFLHADTRFTEPLSRLPGIFKSTKRDWGFFRVRLDAPGWRFRVIEWMMNRRSRFSRIGTGDQGLFVRHRVFQEIGGFADIPLMEDVEICKRLRGVSRPRVLDVPLLTSARRWQRHGVLRTVLLMWRLRLAYFLGVSPERLARQYRACSSPTHES
jgi:rSAM/selenodomain-associated transferase 2